MVPDWIHAEVSFLRSAEVVQYGNSYRLCYIRGPEGILIGLAQELGQQTSR